MQFSIARAQPTDLPLVADVVLDGYQRFYDVYPPEPGFGGFYNLELATREYAYLEFYLARSFGAAIGLVALSVQGEAMIVRHVYARTGWQSRGVGTALLRHAESIGRERGVRTCYLTTDRAAYWAIGFYRRHGYEPLSDEQAERVFDQFYWLPFRMFNFRLPSATFDRQSMGTRAALLSGNVFLGKPL